MNPQTAAYKLISDPVAFLKKYPIKIFGGGAASGICQYFLIQRGTSFRPGAVLGTASMKATERFELRTAGYMSVLQPPPPRASLAVHF